MNIDLEKYQRCIETCDPIAELGRIVDVVGLTIEATGPSMGIGELCYAQPKDSTLRIPVEVVGFRGERILLMALGSMHGIAPGAWLIPTHQPEWVYVGHDLLGRVIDSSGAPLDDGPPLSKQERMPLYATPPRPMDRRRIVDSVATGVRAIDACITSGKGQRLGIMAGSGVGKSKLMGMIARNTSADISVIALIGERGREVRDFVEGDLREEGLQRSVVVVATSDEPALRRIKGAYMATSIAEWYRSQGADVMLLMDSLTRFAMAQREIGLSIGEPPTTKGYPPSMYALLPKLLERAGTSAVGSITGLYTVLVEADDLNDPVGDASRSILDGHIALSRDLASRGHYPPIDVLQSVSRCMTDVTSEEHQLLAQRMRQVLATYRDAEDLINIGAYVQGSNPEIDASIRLMPGIRSFLQQSLTEFTPYETIPALMRKTLGTG